MISQRLHDIILRWLLERRVAILHKIWLKDPTDEIRIRYVLQNLDSIYHDLEYLEEQQRINL